MPYNEPHERYALQPWHVRLWRRCRHEPRAMLEFSRDLLRWAFAGLPMPPEWTECFGRSRIRAVGHLWTKSRSLMHIRMGDYVTGEELMAEIRGRSGGSGGNG